MKTTLTAVLLAGAILSLPVINAQAQTASYQLCNASGCHAGGSTNVTSTYAQTLYPVVLAHGTAGWNSIAGFDYWYGISPDLIQNGASVFETSVAAFDSSYVRGEQLRNQVQQIMAITGSAKVNLIGHSQGSLDVRYVAGVMPAQIASVTTIAGPHKGSPVADQIQGVLSSPIGPVLAPLLAGGINAFFTLFGLASGQNYHQDALAVLGPLTTSGASAFSADFPAGVPTTACGQGAAVVNGVHYYSWSGIGKLTTLIDPTDAPLLATGLLIPGASDGLVPQCSSHLGQVIRDDYPQNHLDEVNQIAGLTQLFATSPVTIYRQHLSRLKLAGL